MTLTTEQTAERKREAEQKQQQKKQERAEETAFVSEHQESLENISAEQAHSPYVLPAIPKLPLGQGLAISRAAKAQLSSKEYGKARAARASGLPKLERDYAKGQSEMEVLMAQMKAVEEKLRKLQAGPAGTHIEERMTLEAQGILLVRDQARLTQTVYLGLQQQIQDTKAALRDPLVQWAEARLEWANAALPIVAGAKLEAEAILKWKREEVENGKVRKDAGPTVDGYLPTGVTRVSPMVVMQSEADRDDED